MDLAINWPRSLGWNVVLFSFDNLGMHQPHAGKRRRSKLQYRIFYWYCVVNIIFYLLSGEDFV